MRVDTPVHANHLHTRPDARLPGRSAEDGRIHRAIIAQRQPERVIVSHFAAPPRELRWLIVVRHPPPAVLDAAHRWLWRQRAQPILEEARPVVWSHAVERVHQ